MKRYHPNQSRPLRRNPSPALTICALSLLLLLAACAARTDRPVRDLEALPQEAGAYHGLDPDAPLLAPDAQRAACERFLAAHFDPWNRTAPRHPARDAFWGLERYAGEPLHGQNTLPRDPQWMERMRAASNVDAYPALSRRAIAVADAAMRVLPTDEPAFYAFDRPGEGYPFDYMQNSLVLAGTPLYATHLSADGDWVLAESRFAFGWVRARDLAWVDDDFARAFRTGKYVAISRDHAPISTEDGQFLFMGEVGTILPVLADGALAAPARDADGRAVLGRASAPAGAAEPMPLAATPANFARVADAMLGRPYGWGGLLGDRDCSALTMDLMAPFGIYLPRNSSQQEKAGTRIPLDGLTREEKKQVILDRAVPFLTLVRKPGHIMLYVGSRDGQPVVLHALWGLKTGTKGSYGRKIVGRAVITTLEPGIERGDLARPSGILLETVTALTTLPGPLTGEPSTF